MMVSGRVLQVVKFFGVFLRHLIGCYLSVIMLSGSAVQIGGFRSRSKVLGNTCRVGNVYVRIRNVCLTTPFGTTCLKCAQEKKKCIYILNSPGGSVD